MRKLFLMLLLLLALAFTACTPPLEKGYVYAKEYDPAWTQLLMTPLTNCWGTGEARECITTYTFTPVYHPGNGIWTLLVATLTKNSIVRPTRSRLTRERMTAPPSGSMSILAISEKGY